MTTQALFAESLSSVLRDACLRRAEASTDPDEQRDLAMIAGHVWSQRYSQAYSLAEDGSYRTRSQLIPLIARLALAELDGLRQELDQLLEQRALDWHHALVGMLSIPRAQKERCMEVTYERAGLPVTSLVYTTFKHLALRLETTAGRSSEPQFRFFVTFDGTTRERMFLASDIRNAADTLEQVLAATEATIEEVTSDWLVS